MSNKQKTPQTYGEKAVGLSFNPSGYSSVDEVKMAFAGVINKLDNLRLCTHSQEIKRMCSVAITEAQTAQMWAVKAITWKD